MSCIQCNRVKGQKNVIYTVLQRVKKQSNVMYTRTVLQSEGAEECHLQSENVKRLTLLVRTCAGTAF